LEAAPCTDNTIHIQLCRRRECPDAHVATAVVNDKTIFGGIPDGEKMGPEGTASTDVPFVRVAVRSVEKLSAIPL